MKQINALNCLMLACLCLIGLNTVSAQDVTVIVDASKEKTKVSPYLYGLNNSFNESAQFYIDAGVRMSRMNGGNNATKYNWKRKISSHPDWYNNVYANDWGQKSLDIAKDHPDMQVMWAFQLLGRVASTNAHNFNDWAYNQSAWWEGVGQNLAGGGVPNEENPGEKALVEGDVNLYTMEWPADSTVAILDGWFGAGGLGLNKNQFLYWNMDNEPDIWNGTHDDVMGDTLLPSTEFMDRFIEVAKKAKEKFPEIKICGPVTTSEWQWFKWGDEGIRIDGKYYCWLEYFIKRLADEEKTTGLRLIDVVDLHNYPYAPTDADALQNHRMYYDKTYAYPGANGIKTINGGWDNSIKQEYIFQRINDWLDQYFGENHGITVGLSEWSPGPDEPNLASVIYASHLGTFANNGVEYFTPWVWFTGMWETMHLFSRYAKYYSVSSTSTEENMVSAYTTVTESLDSTTIMLVNRSVSSAQNVKIQMLGIAVDDGTYNTLQLSSLPANETFVSHSNNALKKNTVNVNSNSFELSIPALSTTAVILTSAPTGTEYAKQPDNIRIYPNPVTDQLTVSFNSVMSEPVKIEILDEAGNNILANKISTYGSKEVTVNTASLPEGYYILWIKNSNNTTARSFAIIR